MSTMKCPHCSVDLVSMRFPLCPSCGLRLSDSSKKIEGRRVGRKAIRTLSILAAIVIGVVILSTMPALIRSGWAEIVYGGLGSVAVFWTASFYLRKTEDDQWFPVMQTMVVCALGMALLTAIAQRDSSRMTDDGIDGIAADGEYRNRLVSIRVRYGAEWRDATGESKSQMPQRGDAKYVLGLVRKIDPHQIPTRALEESATLVFIVVPLSSASRKFSSAEYLDREIDSLKTRSDAPQDVRKEPPYRVAGRTYERVSLLKPSKDGDHFMTFWAAIHCDYLLLIRAAYFSEKGLAAAERLLSEIEPYGLQ